MEKEEQQKQTINLRNWSIVDFHWTSMNYGQLSRKDDKVALKTTMWWIMFKWKFKQVHSHQAKNLWTRLCWTSVHKWRNAKIFFFTSTHTLSLRFFIRKVQFFEHHTHTPPRRVTSFMNKVWLLYRERVITVTICKNI